MNSQLSAGPIATTAQGGTAAGSHFAYAVSSPDGQAPLCGGGGGGTGGPTPMALSSSQHHHPHSSSLPDVDVPASVDHPLYPIAVLLDELQNEDVAQRLTAVRRIPTVALALGPQIAREELVPFLAESLENEDEVLVALAEEFGRLVDYIGEPQHSHILLPPLEKLAAVEETVVRDQAIASLCRISPSMSQQQIEEHFVPAVKRLSTGEWFTNRTSAAGLYSPIYEKATPGTQEELRRLFGQLCHDETPMVRRGSANALAHLLKKVSKEHLLSELVPLAKTLAQDDHDTVRALVVEAVVTATELLSSAEIRIHTLETFRNLCNDKSWRVRQAVAKNFVRAARPAISDMTGEELSADYYHLLRDTEAEVRTVAVAEIPNFATVIDQDAIVHKLIPCIKDLAADSPQNVRAALATSLPGICPLAGKSTVSEHLLPIFLQLLKDEFPEVRLNVISKLQQVNEAIGTETLSRTLYPAIIELVEDKQWRVRQAVIEYIPLLATQLGRSFFDEKLIGLCIAWLSDCVYAVREAATLNLRKLTEVFGPEWAKTNVIPKVLAMATHPNYLYRMTMIFSLTSLFPVVGVDDMRDQIMTTLAKMATDPIPNIRFNVAKAIESLLPVLQKLPQSGPTSHLIEHTLRPALTKLCEDPDNDVRYFGRRASTKAGITSA